MFDDESFLLSNKSTLEKFGIKGIEVISSWAKHYNSWVHNDVNIPVCLIKYESSSVLLIKIIFFVFSNMKPNFSFKKDLSAIQ